MGSFFLLPIFLVKYFEVGWVFITLVEKVIIEIASCKGKALVMMQKIQLVNTIIDGFLSL